MNILSDITREYLQQPCSFAGRSVSSENQNLTNKTENCKCTVLIYFPPATVASDLFGDFFVVSPGQSWLVTCVNPLTLYFNLLLTCPFKFFNILVTHCIHQKNRANIVWLIKRPHMYFISLAHQFIRSKIIIINHFLLLKLFNFWDT